MYESLGGWGGGGGGVQASKTKYNRFSSMCHFSMNGRNCCIVICITKISSEIKRKDFIIIVDEI
jgi:hypothetical protein